MPRAFRFSAHFLPQFPIIHVQTAVKTGPFCRAVGKPIVSNKPDCAVNIFGYPDPVAYPNERREDQMIVLTPHPQAKRSVLSGYPLPLGEGLFLLALLLLAIAGA